MAIIASIQRHRTQWCIAAAILTVAAGDPDPVGGEPHDVVGHDRGVTRTQRPEERAVGGDAESLVPRVVARLEVSVDVEVVGQAPGHLCPQEGLHLLG